ncbi:uncharacterized protein [Littorina saxatilis]|uniref:TNFR-Cys domain-containing protein n=1 Tax=Littorina saxatilis TaxID=31220 RepID=A0AAN9G0Y8_9CAEN
MPVALSLRSPFRRKALTSLLLLSMLLVVALCDEKAALNYQTCYREIKGCEECKKCTNSVSKDECACAKSTVNGTDVLCDDVCMRNEDNSYREKRNWRVLGITLFSISIIVVACTFAGTLVYWSKTDTTDPNSKMSPDPKELAVIEATPELATEEGGSAWIMRESAVGSAGTGGSGTTGYGTSGSTGMDITSSVPREEPEQDALHIAPLLVKSTCIH